jgi:dTDP-4-dehydrorhamnose reductase
MPRISPIATSDYPTAAARPACSVLDNARLQQDFGLVAPDWRAGLSSVLDQLAGSDPAAPDRSSAKA